LAGVEEMVTLLLACTGSPLPEGDATRPDVVLVSIDSLRADHLGAYGYERATSPFLDSLAATGHRFTQAWTMSPWTLPSHTTMLSGVSPLEHAVIEDDRRIPDSLPLVQEAFRAAGYATGGFVSTVYVSRLYGFDRGFDAFSDFGITEKQNLHHPAPANVVVDAALAWVSKQEGRPAFLFLHLYDVHYPYLPPEPHNALFDRPGSAKAARYRNYAYYQQHPLEPKALAHQVAQYDECIAWVDAELRRLSDTFAASGREVRFVITADHGEEFGERGSWGHAHTLYPEVMRIPLIVSDTLDHGAVHDARVGTLDIAATVAGLGRVPFASAGVDVLGTIPPARDWPMETSRFDSARLGLLSGEARGERRLDLDLAHDRTELFDRARDPGENDARLTPAPELEAAAWAAVGMHWTSTGPVTTLGWARTPDGTVRHALPEAAIFAVYPPDATVLGPATRDVPLPPQVALSEDTREQLKALGYEQ
jgi:arylsulfatase A-like enzyme